MTPEGAIKRSICDYLTHHYPTITFWINESQGTYDPRRGIFMKKKSKYQRKGVADILGILPGGRFLAIEVKTIKGRVSPEQKEFLDQINSSGGMAFVARSILDVEAAMVHGGY